MRYSINKSKIALVALGAATLLFAAAWAAEAEPSKGSAHVTAATPKKAVISAFKRPFHPTKAQRAQRRAIKRMIKRSPRGSIAASAAASHSRAVPVEGYPATVWIAPAADGSVCTFIPDPVDGWGAGCATAHEVASGHAMTMLGGSPGTSLGDSAIVAAVVPDGYEDPSVRRADGSVSVLTTNSNVAAAVVPPGALVRSGRAAITVPDPNSSDLSP